MKKWFILILMSSLLMGCTSSKKKNEEEGAHLFVAVNTNEVGEALVSLWNELYPEEADLFETVTIENPTARTYLEHEELDLWYLPEAEGVYLLNRTKALSEEKTEEIFATVHADYSSILNLEETRFVPMDTHGYLFAYNRNLAMNLGMNLMDENNDGLPEVFDTFEEIFDLTKRSDLFCVFPFTFKEVISFYPMLTAGGWQFCASLQADETGFESEEFLTGLEFIKECGRKNWYPEVVLTSEQYPYAYDQVLVDNTTLFTFISEDMYFEDAQKAGVNYVYCPMPSYNENTLTPLSQTYGYMMNHVTAYPQTAERVLAFIRSANGMQCFIENSEVVPVLNLEQEWSIEEEILDKVRAYQSSVSESLIALATDTTVKAFNMYFEINWMQTIQDVFDQKISPTEGQRRIVEESQKWLESYGYDFTEETSDGE